MTATSGPGFSLMQENLGFGVIAEVPCVIVNVMREGQAPVFLPRPLKVISCKPDGEPTGIIPLLFFLPPPFGMF